MSDDYDDDDRPRRKRVKPKSSASNSTAKILLIVFGSLAGVAVLGCCGIVGSIYFMAQKVMNQMEVKTPAEIQQMTAEMTDITIPPEFVPKVGHSIILLKSTEYEWCPTGTCAARHDGLGTMTLTMITVPQDKNSQATSPIDLEEEFTKEQLEKMQAATHEFTIRGRKCRFLILQGDMTTLFDDADDTMEADESETVTSAEAVNEPANANSETPVPAAVPAVAAPAGPKSVRISGHFPGKGGQCSLEINLTPEEYNEAKILDMLKSIR